MTEDWINRFEGLFQIDEPVKDLLRRQSTVLDMAKGTTLFGPGRAPEHLLLLLDGRVRVQQVTEAGREIVLYRVNAGESCVLTTACLLANEEYTAEGIAETDIRAATIPRQVFHELVSRSLDFRTFIFTAYSRRITDLFLLVEEIAFQRIDVRMAQKLMELAWGGVTIRTTHQQMAAELGTAREVVTRHLGEFQRRGWIAQTRGVITLLDGAGVARLASTP